MILNHFKMEKNMGKISESQLAFLFLFIGWVSFAFETFSFFCFLVWHTNVYLLFLFLFFVISIISYSNCLNFILKNPKLKKSQNNKYLVVKPTVMETYNSNVTDDNCCSNVNRNVKCYINLHQKRRCKQCGHTWKKRAEKETRQCLKCGSRDWKK